MPDKTQEYEIDYKEDSNLIGGYVYPGGMNAYTYDCFDRLTSKIHTNLFFTYYTYLTDSEGNTSNLISRFRYMNPDGNYENYDYTYDNLGNITSISKDGSVICKYTYDELGQLILEENVPEGDAYYYTYDTAGNILQKESFMYFDDMELEDYFDLSDNLRDIEATYTYSSSPWGDLLTNYRNTAITYDEIGNPLNWHNASSMTWEARQLTNLTGTNNRFQIAYTYNSDGIRTGKTFTRGTQSITYDYVLDGTKIIKESVNDGISNTSYVLYYFYDESGVAGFEYNGVNYYFVKNIQGDVIEICNWSDGSVVQYTYDAWGNVLSTTGTLASTVGRYNPFRYRGYYYDTETRFYYLNLRYYDPEVCRFINADSFVSTGQGILGNNMFAYCGNNPVMNVDPTGEKWWHWALGATVVAACAVATVVTCGGFAAAATAVCMVGNGVAAATTASTVAASAFIGSATVYGTAVLSAASTSSSVQEFNDQGNWGTVASTASGALFNGTVAYATTRTQTTTVYRSVSDAEAQDIKTTGQFNLAPGGMESKQFGFDMTQTKQFGDMMGQNTIVSANVPNSMLNQLDTVGVDSNIFRAGTLTVHADQLDAFNRAINGTIRFMYK